MPFNIIDPSGICRSNKTILTHIVSIINKNEPLFDKTYFIDELLRRTIIAFDNNETWTLDRCLCLDATTIGGKCPALYFAIYHQHIGLTQYVLSKMEPSEITKLIFKFACEFEDTTIVQMLCEKDPSRFFMKTNKMGTREGRVRTPKEISQI